MLVVIGGGLFQTFALKKAKEMGLKTVCVDMDSNACGRNICDVFINKSTRDHKGIIQEIHKREIIPTGVITVGTDMSRTVYYVSKEFGLDPGFSDPEKIVNKICMRQALERAEISQPSFVFSETIDDLLQKRKKMNLKYPLVLKPAENMGARGVVKVYSDSEVEENFHLSKDYSIDNRVILEEYMKGEELSVECIVYDNNLFTMVIGDRHIEKEPYFVETGHTCPSKISLSTKNKVENLMRKSAKALEIYNGPIKGDIKITDKEIMVGEIAGRLSGGFMSSHTLPLSSGIDAIKVNIKQRINKKINKNEILPYLKNACIERAIIPEKTGIIKSISGIEKALDIKGVEYIHLNMKEGDVFKELKNNIGKIGNIVISADNIQKAEEIYNKVQKIIKVVIK